eukprot:GHVN01053144.1.p1 GENE.GHVN01053144.1~~GHVN01053144.1.p1  ORF type:complete len:558 (-),score=39.25 GHVN01053144.1:139-1812(-)
MNFQSTHNGSPTTSTAMSPLPVLSSTLLTDILSSNYRSVPSSILSVRSSTSAPALRVAKESLCPTKPVARTPTATIGDISRQQQCQNGIRRLRSVEPSLSQAVLWPSSIECPVTAPKTQQQNGYAPDNKLWHNLEGSCNKVSQTPTANDSRGRAATQSNNRKSKANSTDRCQLPNRAANTCNSGGRGQSSPLTTRGTGDGSVKCSQPFQSIKLSSSKSCSLSRNKSADSRCSAPSQVDRRTSKAGGSPPADGRGRSTETSGASRLGLGIRNACASPVAKPRVPERTASNTELRIRADRNVDMPVRSATSSRPSVMSRSREGALKVRYGNRVRTPSPKLACPDEMSSHERGMRDDASSASVSHLSVSEAMTPASSPPTTPHNSTSPSSQTRNVTRTFSFMLALTRPEDTIYTDEDGTLSSGGDRRTPESPLSAFSSTGDGYRKNRLANLGGGPHPHRSPYRNTFARGAKTRSMSPQPTSSPRQTKPSPKAHPKKTVTSTCETIEESPHGPSAVDGLSKSHPPVEGTVERTRSTMTPRFGFDPTPRFGELQKQLAASRL